MPWECKTVNKLREEFVAKVMLKEESMSSICRQYGISRTTGYKWVARYLDGETMLDKSHEPFNKPYKTNGDTEQMILSVRYDHPTWGARKIKRFLENKGQYDLPSVSTISNILKRCGCVCPEAAIAHTPYKRFEMSHPNDMWQMDYKGHFAMVNGERCHPLTMIDDHSRFSLCIDASSNEQWIPTRESLVRVFREYGMPKAILCDNGSPWSDNTNGYTPFEIWMIQMDVLPIHGRPIHPQTQGKDERFHRTLKEDLLNRTPIRDLEHAQKEFDKFRYCYNYERPHSALNLDVPAKHYSKSKVKYIEYPQEPIYDSGADLRKVNFKGYISICRHRYYLSESFIGKLLELRPLDENQVALLYGNFRVAVIDLDEQLFVSRKIIRS